MWGEEGEGPRLFLSLATSWIGSAAHSCTRADWRRGHGGGGVDGRLPLRHPQLKEQRRDDGHSRTSSAPVTELKDRMETHGIYLSVSENSSQTCKLLHEQNRLTHSCAEKFLKKRKINCFFTVVMS